MWLLSVSVSRWLGKQMLSEEICPFPIGVTLQLKKKAEDYPG